MEDKISRNIQLKTPLLSFMLQTSEQKKIEKGVWISPLFYFAYFNLLAYFKIKEPNNLLLQPIDSTTKYFSYIPKKTFSESSLSSLHSFFQKEFISFEDVYEETEIQPTLLFLSVLSDYGISYRNLSYTAYRRLPTYHADCHAPSELDSLFRIAGARKVENVSKKSINKIPIGSGNNFMCRSSGIDSIRQSTRSFSFVDTVNRLFYPGQMMFYPDKDYCNGLSLSVKQHLRSFSVDHILEHIANEKKGFLNSYASYGRIQAKNQTFWEKHMTNKARKDLVAFLDRDFYFTYSLYAQTNSKAFYLNCSLIAQHLSSNSMMDKDTILYGHRSFSMSIYGTDDIFSVKKQEKELAPTFALALPNDGYEDENKEDEKDENKNPHNHINKDKKLEVIPATKREQLALFD